MKRDKQNEEMRYLADEMGKAISTEYEKRVLADERKLEAVLKANGWRKSTDLAREIFEEIRKIFKRHRIEFDMSCIDFYFDKQFRELEKKYVEDTE